MSALLFYDLFRLTLTQCANSVIHTLFTLSARARCLPGIPNELYSFSSLPAVDCSRCSTNALLPANLLDLVVPFRTCENVDFAAYLEYVCAANVWEKLTDVDAAKHLYCQLLPYCDH